MRGLIPLLLLFTTTLSCFPHISPAAESGWHSFGIRGGLSADSKDNYLRQGEVFARYQLPWELRAASGFGIGTMVEVAAGVLYARGDLGAVGSIGPTITVGSPTFPLYIDFGISAAGMSRDTFGDRDYNGYGQFISHGGLNLRLNRTLGIGYRFQHMSNAGINGGKNPGTNLHLVGLVWETGR